MTAARDELRGVIGNVLVNANNYPEKAAPHLLGRDMGPLLDKTTDALILAGYVKHRVLTTVAEVEALAPGSLIYDDMDRPAGGFHLFRMVNDFISMGGIRFPVESIRFPVTVLFTPVAT